MKKSKQEAAEQPKKKKKGLAVFLCLAVVILAVVLIAKVASGSDGGTEKTSADAPNGNVASLNETIKANDLSFTATEIRKEAGNTFTSPSEQGKVFVGVKFTIENTGATNKSVAYIAPIFDTYADNAKCLLAPLGQTIFGNALNGDIAPGMSMTGWHVVEVPRDAKTLVIELGVLYRDSANVRISLDIPQG